MLGLALSFGASAPFLTEPELALAADGSALTVLPAASREGSQSLKFSSTKSQAASAYHTVEAGESLWQIAAQHEADVQIIKAANGIAVDEVLRVGQVIRVPAVGMENLATAADSSRLALKADVLGGVGGDLVAADNLNSLRVGPAVSDLEKIRELEDNLALERAEDLTEDSLIAADQLPAEDMTDAAEARDQSKIAQVPALPMIEPVAAAEGEWSTAVVEASQPVALANTPERASAPESPTLVTSLPLHEEASRPVSRVTVQPAPSPAPSSELATEVEAAVEAETADTEIVDSSKDLLAAALPLRPATRDAVAETGTIRSYQVKPGDTLWSIASRNGLTLDELLTHNHAVNQPETLSVGDSLSIPVASSLADVEGSSPLPTSGLAAAPQTREQVIRDHLARIRESNSSTIDRDELNARIREARQELERSRSETSAPAASLEYYSPEPVALASEAIGGAEPASQSTLIVREEDQAVASQWTVTDVAQHEPHQLAAVQSSVAPGLIAPTAVESTAAESVPPESTTSSSQLLAAAPLGADAYRVMPNLPVGQTVSPNMPMMPGASEFLPEAPALSNGYIWPTHGTFTSGYGWRWGRMHRGIDIAGPVGTPIVAAASGVVVRSGWNSGGYGNLVDIRHPDGSMTRYAHNSRLLVRQGEQVGQGQQIAEMGSTGYSTGPHLHFEIHTASGTVNPMAYLPGR
ncbi:MAG: peptidoglycan DD-metalloendopeptidase family protein [Nodosilinea sp.]